MKSQKRDIDSQTQRVDAEITETVQNGQELGFLSFHNR